jgi:hypothetical protein
MSSEVLREYLVGLGFKLDDKSFRRFQDALAKTGKDAAQLGAEVIAAGAAMTEMVERVSGYYNNLFFLSQRTGATVKSLDAISYAATQVGVSAGEAQGAVDAFASSMRRNPGLAAFYRGLTGQAPTGNSEKDLRTLFNSQRGVPDFVALQRLQMFGQNENTYLQYRNNSKELDEAIADHIQRMKEAGLEADEEAARYRNLQQQLNRTADEFSIVGQRIAKDVNPEVQALNRHTGDVLQSFAQLDVATEGYLGKILAIIGAVGGVQVFSLLLQRALGVALPSVLPIAAPLVGAKAAWDIIGNMESKNDTGRPPDWDEIAKLPWWRRVAIGAQMSFGADPNQFLPGGNNYHPPAISGERGPVGSSNRVVGDTEGVFGGLYDAPTMKYIPRDNNAFNLTQNNHFGGQQSNIEQTFGRLNESNRWWTDALRNLYPKFQ